MTMANCVRLSLILVRSVMWTAQRSSSGTSWKASDSCFNLSLLIVFVIGEFVECVLQHDNLYLEFSYLVVGICQQGDVPVLGFIKFPAILLSC